MSGNREVEDEDYDTDVYHHQQHRSVELGDCRFYEPRLPQPDELVMVVVKRVADLGAYVSLLEYNHVEGLILMNELSKRRFRSVSKLVKVGRTEVAMVLRVDKTKGYIDLSKRRVGPEDIIACEEKYSTAKLVQTIMRQVAQTFNMRVEDLNSKVAWELEKQHGNAHEAFKNAVGNPEILDNLDIAPKIRDAIVLDITRRLTPKAINLRVRVDVACSAYDGVVAVRESLLKALTYNDGDNFNVSVKLIAPPQYAIMAICLDQTVGMERMNQVIECVRLAIISRKGQFAKKSEVVVLGGGDSDKHLKELLQGIEDDGRDDEDDDEEEEQDETMGEVAADVPEDQIVQEKDG